MTLLDSQLTETDPSGRLREWFNGGGGDPSELVSIIGNLPTLALDVFTAVNDDHSRIDKGVDRLDQALILLGTTRLRNLLHQIRTDNPIRRFGDEDFVQNARKVARAAALVARAARVPLEAEAFAAGLFIDIGTLLLKNRFPLRHAEAEAQAHAHGNCTVEYERLLLGTDHADESEQFLRQSGFPTTLTDSVLFHHDPLNAPRPARFRALLLHLGDYVANPDRSPWTQSEAANRLRARILSYLRLDTATLEELTRVLGSESSYSGKTDDEKRGDLKS